MSLRDDVVKTAKLYLGPVAERFADRQVCGQFEYARTPGCFVLAWTTWLTGVARSSSPPMSRSGKHHGEECANDI